MNEELIERINKWKTKIGLFVAVTYKADSKNLPARGKLEEVTDSGIVTIRDTVNHEKEWELDLETIKSSTFEPLKEVKNGKSY